MKSAFVLRGATVDEMESEALGYEIELATVFRGIESEMYKELRKAVSEGLTIDQAIARAAAVLDKEIPDAVKKTDNKQK